MTCPGGNNKIAKLNYFRISESWPAKSRIKFIKPENLALYPLSPNKIYKIQKIKSLFILSTIFILLYNQRDTHHFKYYI